MGGTGGTWEGGGKKTNDKRNVTAKHEYKTKEHEEYQYELNKMGVLRKLKSNATRRFDGVNDKWEAGREK